MTEKNINITWTPETELTGRDAQIHQSLEPSEGLVGRSENNYAVYIHRNISPTTPYGVRGGYRDHTALSFKAEFATRDEAIQAATAWLEKKEQDRLMRSIKAGAKLAAYSLLLAVGLASAPPQADADMAVLALLYSKVSAGLHVSGKDCASVAEFTSVQDAGAELPVDPPKSWYDLAVHLGRAHGKFNFTGDEIDRDFRAAIAAANADCEAK